MRFDRQALVVDDEPQIRHFVARILRAEGWTVGEAESAEDAFQLLREQCWSLVFCDVCLGNADGYTVLRRFTQEQPEARIILMTGNGSAAGALDATAGGAYDYLLKPFSASAVKTLSQEVSQRLESQARQPREAPPEFGYTSDLKLIGRSAAFIEVMKLVGRIAPTNLPVLMTGESGTGKEVIARAIHGRSARASQAFIAVNCGALPGELIETELFGHVRGSFTGADRDRVGLWEEAHGGTIFLDEITETSPAFQVKLLRALQGGEIRRVGSNRVLHVDVRVIAATNRDPEADVRAGRFRQDLLYRLNAVNLYLPPLRERQPDILSLAKYFVARGRAAGEPPLSFSTEAIRLLEAYPWPGNIRELENAVVRAAAICDHSVRPADLPERIRAARAAAECMEATPVEANGEEKDEWLPLAEVERRYAVRALAHSQGNKQAAARLLGIDRKTLVRIIKRQAVDPKQESEASPVDDSAQDAASGS